MHSFFVKNKARRVLNSLKCNKERKYVSSMHFAREDCSSPLLIRACARGEITIGDQRYQHSLIVTSQEVIPHWRPSSCEELESGDFDTLRSLQPEVILLGTGERLQFPASRLTVSLLEAGIGMEVMDTAAACRTFNILLSEGRQVVAALLLGSSPPPPPPS